MIVTREERQKILPKCFALGNPYQDIGERKIISEGFENETDAEMDDDAFRVELYKQYPKDLEREETVSIEEAAKLLGIDLNVRQGT